MLINFAQQKILHRWGVATYVLLLLCMALRVQEGTIHQLHFLDTEREELFDEDVMKFSMKLANLETHPNLRRPLFTFVREKGKVQF